MGKMVEIRSPTQGLIGFLHEVECETSDSVLIFQLPRETKMLSDSYVQGALEKVRQSLPEGRKALVVGADVNVYELAGADAIILRLKGII
jgi:hypothetical protein